jgi:hypothetical protein
MVASFFTKAWIEALEGPHWKGPNPFHLDRVQVKLERQESVVREKYVKEVSIRTMITKETHEHGSSA